MLFGSILDDFWKELDLFFRQWLWQPGHPILDLAWEQTDESINITIRQIQNEFLFQFPLELELKYENGTSGIKTIQFNERQIQLSFPTKTKIKEVILDPGIKLLFELSSQ